MVEMRWHNRMKLHEDGYMYGPIRVLQYRYKYPEQDSRVNAYPPRDWIWSDWKDVPEESLP